jgi:Leucine-rich repeat (LRR) protein
MKKFLLLSLLLCLQLFAAKAQFVTIPDTSFANRLTQLYPTCMNGNQMDTTCAQIVNAAILYFNSSYISDLTGVEYFDSAIELNCNNNQLTNLPVLPGSLKKLNCSYNQMTNISALPNSLTLLDCYKNQLSGLPLLPDSLKTLRCDYNQLTSLPILPNFLQTLRCDHNQLSNLPNLPSSLQTLDCYYNQLTSLPLLPIALQTLQCNYNQLSSLPSLPNVLKILSCYNNPISSLPALPDSLQKLFCKYNQLTSLPALPSSLQELSCENNQLTALPVLPGTLTGLFCDFNQLTALPTLPASLIKLYCSNNQLSNIPSLPAQLNYLWCYYNPLTNNLPLLPDSLLSLNCHNNQLTALPSTLPNTIKFFACDDNQLTMLPALPDHLSFFTCGNNQITYMPTLPSTLYQFGCGNNLLTYLPEVPDTMWSFIISNNNILCLNNLPYIYINNYSYVQILGNPLTCVPNLTNYTGNLPLCLDNDLINNPNNCPSVNITGQVYTDLNSNCGFNNADLSLDNIPVKLYDNQSNFLELSYSVNGTYSFATLLPDTYQVKINDNLLPIAMSCGQSNNQSVTLSAPNQTIAGVNFPVVCDTAYDLSVLSVAPQGWVFPGQTHKLKTNIIDGLTWYNLNCNSSNYSGTVNIQVTGPVTYVSPDVGALTPQVNGNTFTYFINNFSSLNSSTFGLQFLVDTTAQANDQICVHVEILSTQQDVDASNNVYDFCYQVVNSYDPNMKEVYPTNLLPGYDGWFTYTIHFQNTGNAPAFNIRLRDTLDTNLDINTFEALAFSHTATTLLNGNILTVRFNNIMLPDSTTDYEGSMGYFQYRIKPFPNLPIGSQISNTAYIYFDYNSPIVTNTTQNNFYCFPVNYSHVYSFCSEDSIQVGNNWYSSPAMYTDTLTSVFGCDSIATTIINQIIVDTALTFGVDTIFAMPNYSNYEWINCTNDSTIQNSSSNNFAIPFSGNFKVKITNSNGCYAMSSCIPLTMNCALNATQQSFTICTGDSINVGINWYASAGIFTDTLLTSAGCDSVITTNVNETFIDTMLLIIGDTLFANAGYSNYIWIDCLTGDTINNGTSNLLVAPYSGIFKTLISTNNGCYSTTSCVPLIVTGIERIVKMSNEFILYPNPSNGIFNFKDVKNLKQVEVYNLLGESILAQGNQKQINLSGFAKGIYYARINSEVVVKLVKE